ncbi:MAG: hypothetical protein HYZ51_01260 [Candidatus Doudnabacteria bacterium]|nr:hypothetical protein [Candidatus Doudnabacteria bacterium]
MAIVSPEREAMLGLIQDGQKPWQNVTASNRHVVRLEDGTLLHYWGLRNDLASQQARVAVGFALAPALREREENLAWRLVNATCFGYLFDVQEQVIWLEALEIVSCSDDELVLRRTGLKAQYQPVI